MNTKLFSSVGLTNTRVVKAYAQPSTTNKEYWEIAISFDSIGAK